MVRAPDSRVKGHGFESLQEWHENILLLGQLSVLTLMLQQQHVKDTGHSATSVGSRFQLNMHAPCTHGLA